MLHANVTAFLDTLSTEQIREILDLYKMMRTVSPVVLMEAIDELQFYLDERMELTDSE